MRCHSLWQSSHKSSRWRRFFWRTIYFCPHNSAIIFNSGLWTGKAFNTLTPSSARHWCAARDQQPGAGTCWKISPSSKTCARSSLNVISHILLLLELSLQNMIVRCTNYCSWSNPWKKKRVAKLMRKNICKKKNLI